MIIKDKIQKLSKSRFLHSIIILASGSIIAQLITFICVPLLTRIYTPTEMGDFTFVITFVTMFSCVINFRYDVLIVTAKDGKTAAVISLVSAIICFVFSILVTVGIYLYIYIYKTEYLYLKSLLLLVFPLLIVAGIINILNNYNNRTQEYKLMSQVYVIRSFAQNALMILLGLFKIGSLGLVISQLLGQIVGLKRQSQKLRAERELFKNITKDEVKEILVSNKKQPLFSMPATFVNAVSYSMINLMVGGMFGMDILGLYSISYRVLGIPLGIFSANVSKIHYESANQEIINTGNCKRTTRNTILFALVTTFIMVIVLMLFAPQLFSLFFGSAWEKSGIYVQILAPMFGARLIVGSVGYGFILACKQQMEFIIQCMLFIDLVIIYFIGKSLAWSIITFLLAISVSYTVIYILELLLIIYYSKKSQVGKEAIQ